VRPEDEPAETEVIRGQLERVTYVNEDNGYSVYRIRVQDDADPVVAVGISVSHVPGEELEFTGHWSLHPKFGIQFQFSDCRQLFPSTLEGIKKYLCSGLVKGIGPAIALRIVEKFGESSLDIIDKDPCALLEVRGIGRKLLDMIKQSWEAQRGVSAVMRFLQSNGISAGFAAKIFRVYGAESIRVVRDNPYKLADDVFGIGFLTADKFARNMGVPQDSDMRIDAGIQYAMSELTGEGHVYAPREVLAERAGYLLGVTAEAADAAIGRAAIERALAAEVIEPGGSSGERVEAIYLPMYYA